MVAPGNTHHRKKLISYRTFSEILDLFITTTVKTARAQLVRDSNDVVVSVIGDDHVVKLWKNFISIGKDLMFDSNNVFLFNNVAAVKKHTKRKIVCLEGEGEDWKSFGIESRFGVIKIV